MSVFDPSFYTNHTHITEIISKLESMRDDLEEVNRADLLDDIDPFLLSRIHEEVLELVSELQKMEENISETELKKAIGQDL